MENEAFIEVPTSMSQIWIWRLKFQQQHAAFACLTAPTGGSVSPQLGALSRSSVTQHVLWWSFRGIVEMHRKHLWTQRVSTCSFNSHLHFKHSYKMLWSGFQSEILNIRTEKRSAWIFQASVADEGGKIKSQNVWFLFPTQKTSQLSCFLHPPTRKVSAEALVEKVTAGRKEVLQQLLLSSARTLWWLIYYQ